MQKIDRNTFLRQSLSFAALASLSPLNNLLGAQGPSTGNHQHNSIMDRLVTANDKVVATLLATVQTDKLNRKLGFDIASLSASYCSPKSKYHRDKILATALEKSTNLLLSFQSADGTVNLANLESPPDTAFLLEPVTAAASLLSKETSTDVTNVVAALKQFIIKAAEALTTGGVHTPNHRWVICAVLAKINALYPNKKYIARIEDWLGEGIFIDGDGHFPERSMNYGVVEDNSLITMSHYLNKPALLEPVRRNLNMTYYYMEPNGDLVTTDSRRQDQYSGKSIVAFYLHYRYRAIRDKNGMFAAVTRLIETMKGFDETILAVYLFHFLENPELLNELPADVTLPVNYEKLFTTSSLLRIRSGNKTATLFGGVDWPLIIASGRSDSPNFFSYRNGQAVLKYMRLSTNFFSMGYFYSDGLKKTGDQYLLYKKLEAPYYQPLPKKLRKPSGDYTLSPSIDDRFWNKMDFKNRPVSNVKTLETTVSLLGSKNELTFNVSGQPGVQVTLELCFKEGGKLSGVTAGDNGNSFLEKDFGKYEFEGDIIEFGPGALAHRVITGLEGEKYSTHFGTLRTEGLHVYLTGVTPFKHTVSFR